MFVRWPRWRLLLIQVTACFWLNSGRCHSPVSSTCTQVLDRVPDVLEAEVQRREAEAQDVRHLRVIAGAEVADHAARDQRLHDGVGARSPSRIARQTCEPRCAWSRGVTSARPCPAQRCLDQRDEQVGQRQRLGAQRRHRRRSEAAAASTVSRPHSSAGQREDRLRAAQVARDARRPAGSAGVNSKGAAWPHQPASGCSKRLGVARVHPDEGRRAGAAVEVLVAAADREVGVARRCSVDRHRAGAVRQVPDRQRAGGVRRGA